jgi:hypothetical protein
MTRTDSGTVFASHGRRPGRPVRGRMPIPLLLCLVAALGGCGRDEGSEPEEGPIKTVLLPTVPPKAGSGAPKATTKTGPQPTPPIVAEAPAAAAKPTAAHAAEPTAAPPTAARAAVAAPPTPTSAAAPTMTRGVVGSGVDLLAGPSADARVRGTFEGRTTVEVLREENGYSYVRTPIVDGGSVEGWVASASVKPVAKPAAGPDAATAKAPKEGGPPKGAAPPAKPMASPAKAAAKGNGPDDILLQPIAGTEKKRAATPFTHKKHYADYSVKCADCHHPVKALGGAEPPQTTCSEAGCHMASQCNNQAVPKKNAACPNFEDAYHTNCIDCHKKQGGPAKCAECHTG